MVSGHMLFPLSGRPPTVITNIASYTNSQMKLTKVGRNLRFILTHRVTSRNLVSPSILDSRVITHIYRGVLVLTTFSFRDVFTRNISVEVGIWIKRIENGCICKGAYSAFNWLARFTFGLYGRNIG